MFRVLGVGGGGPDRAEVRGGEVLYIPQGVEHFVYYLSPTEPLEVICVYTGAGSVDSRVSTAVPRSSAARRMESANAESARRRAAWSSAASRRADSFGAAQASATHAIARQARAVVMPAADATMNRYHLLGNVECASVLTLRLFGGGPPGELACGDGIHPLESFAMKNEHNGEIVRSYHEAAVRAALEEAERALAHKDPKMSAEEAQSQLAMSLAQLSALERLRKNLKH